MLKQREDIGQACLDSGLVVYHSQIYWSEVRMIIIAIVQS